MQVFAQKTVQFVAYPDIFTIWASKLFIFWSSLYTRQTKNNFLGPVHTGTLKERLPGFTEENTSEKHNFSQKFYLFPGIYFGMEMSSWSGEYIIGLFGHYFLTNLIVWISRCCIEASSKHQFCRIR